MPEVNDVTGITQSYSHEELEHMEALVAEHTLEDVIVHEGCCLTPEWVIAAGPAAIAEWHLEELPF